MQDRMREWANLTPEQRAKVRDTYKEFNQLPSEQKQTVKQKWEAYSNLPHEEKQRVRQEGKSSQLLTPPPVVEPPVVEPPVVNPPIVDPPIVDPPIVEPPVVEPPVTPEPPSPPSATAPSSPRTLTLRSVSRAAYTLSWTIPNNGGSPITDYRIARKVSSRGVFVPVDDGVSLRRSVRIPRPTNGAAVYVRLVAVNAVGESTPPTVVMLKGRRIYAIPSVVAVRFSDAAAFAGLAARSTPYDGTSVARGFAHWSFL